MWGNTHLKKLLPNHEYHFLRSSSRNFLRKGVGRKLMVSQFFFGLLQNFKIFKCTALKSKSYLVHLQSLCLLFNSIFLAIHFWQYYNGKILGEIELFGIFAPSLDETLTLNQTHCFSYQLHSVVKLFQKTMPYLINVFLYGKKGPRTHQSLPLYWLQ